MKNILVIFFLLILVIICISASTTKRPKSTKKVDSHGCKKNAKGRSTCVCGKKKIQFSPLNGEKCIDGQIYQLVVPSKSRLPKRPGLRIPSTPIYQSTPNNGELWQSPVLRIKREVWNIGEQTFVPLQNLSVEAWIDSFTADLTLTQVFVNQENNPIEAIYVFPIEENAAVYSFTAQIDDRKITAELKEKKTAETEYQSAVEQGHTAVLFQQSHQTLDTFTINVGALPPGKECRITIQYVTELDLVNETSIRFVVPTTIAPRYNPSLGHLQSPERLGADYVQKTPYSMRFQAHVLRGDHDKIMQVANMSHPLNVTVTSQSIVVSSECIALDRDIILDVDLPTNRPLTSVTIDKFNDSSSTAVLLAFTPRYSDIIRISDGSDLSNTEFIFIVDCSGSMSEESRINLAREAMLLFIRSLSVGAHFNIIRFGSHYDILFKSETLTTIYNETTAKEAERLSKSMEADFGGTELLEPLQYLKRRPPIKGRSRQVFLLTDGEVFNTDEVIDLCRSMASTTRVFSFGLGHSSSRSLVKGLARATNGYFVFVPPNSKVDTYVASQFGRALQPSIVNAQLQWHGLSTSGSQAPKRIPPLYVNDRVLVYALLDQDQLNSGNVTVDLVVEGHTISSIRLPSNAAEKRDTIRRLAAKALIQELQHQKSDSGDAEDGETREQRITGLSLNHGILSPYTAFVGVERTGPKVNANDFKVRHIPIQITKGDERLSPLPIPYYVPPLPNFGDAGHVALPMLIPTTDPSPPSVAYFGFFSRGPPIDGCPHCSPSYSASSNSLLSTDPVRWLIDQQSFNGVWSLNESDIGKLTAGESFSSFQSTLTSDRDALTTALAIAILESKYSDQKTLWNAVVEKGRKQLSNFGLTDDQINLLINEMKSKL